MTYISPMDGRQRIVIWTVPIRLVGCIKTPCGVHGIEFSTHHHQLERPRPTQPLSRLTAGVRRQRTVVDGPEARRGF
jgi:hypothetical protein